MISLHDLAYLQLAFTVPDRCKGDSPCHLFRASCGDLSLCGLTLGVVFRGSFLFPTMHKSWWMALQHDWNRCSLAIMPGEGHSNKGMASCACLGLAGSLLLCRSWRFAFWFPQPHWSRSQAARCYALYAGARAVIRQQAGRPTCPRACRYTPGCLPCCRLLARVSDEMCAA